MTARDRRKLASLRDMKARLERHGPASALRLVDAAIKRLERS